MVIRSIIDRDCILFSEKEDIFGCRSEAPARVSFFRQGLYGFSKQNCAQEGACVQGKTGRQQKSLGRIRALTTVSRLPSHLPPVSRICLFSAAHRKINRRCSAVLFSAVSENCRCFAYHPVACSKVTGMTECDRIGYIDYFLPRRYVTKVICVLQGDLLYSFDRNIR